MRAVVVLTIFCALVSVMASDMDHKYAIKNYYNYIIYHLKKISWVRMYRFIWGPLKIADSLHFVTFVETSYLNYAVMVSKLWTT